MRHLTPKNVISVHIQCEIIKNTIVSLSCLMSLIIVRSDYEFLESFSVKKKKRFTCNFATHSQE